MLNYYATTIGTVNIKQDDQRFKIQIRQGNCLAVLIHVCKIKEGENKGLYRTTLYQFFLDGDHMKRMLKQNGYLLPEATSISLNMYYKECWTLLKWLTKAGHQVKCYYQEPKPTKNTKK